MRRFPSATLVLAAVVLAAFGVELAGGVEPFALAHGFDPGRPSFEGALGSLVLHASAAHLLGNVLALVLVGAVVERELGWRTVVLFVLGGFAGCALHALLAPAGDVLVGASGGIAALLAVGAVIRPRVVLAFTAAWIALNLVGLFVPTSGVSAPCHVGGFLCGAAVVFARVARFGTRLGLA